MKNDLAAAGMRTAFTNSADFTGIDTHPEPLWIDDVIHQAFLAVDEDGAEAAAATGVRALGGFSKPESPVVVRCDRPFLVLIRHMPSGAWLFLGRVTDPIVD